ncbi:MAG TPA: DeoR/GlpR family DNA-binding transcription regulator [Spirochaetia bacterium]|nr:DeoR/GlpR family DNA-binding transcription regulator [Spirochaetia bacterium]
MLSAERHELILRLLRHGRFVTIADISNAARSSSATIRRDLARLEEAGLLRRVRGGAEIATRTASIEPAGNELPLEYRKAILLEKKRLIAQAAAGLCEDGETIIIDGGSTTFQMAEFLRDREIRIITNSFAIASALVPSSRCTLILNGGVVRMDSQLVLDPFGGDIFANYSASKLFMGAYGIDETGATNNDSLLITTERAMIERARDLIMLVDSTKFDRRGSLVLCGLKRISVIITDEGVSETHQQMVAEHGVRLLTP